MKTLALAATLALVSISAKAEDAVVDVPCQPLSTAAKADGYRPLSHDEWIAARVMFWMAPNTPSAFPPGEGGLLGDNDDDTASVLFVDGGEACAPMRVGGDGLAILKALRAGVVTHPKGRM